MKRVRVLFYSIIIVALTLSHSQGIPNQVGGGGFVNPAGMRFEKFASLSKTWAGKIKLPGDWADWKDSQIKDSRIILYRLNMSADVFGIRASQVTAQIKDDRVARFQVLFDRGESQNKDLFNQLITNIQSFTGESVDPKHHKFVYNKVVFQLEKKPSGAVLLIIRPT